jgi:hypothetical protein
MWETACEFASQDVESTLPTSCWSYSFIATAQKAARVGSVTCRMDIAQISRFNRTRIESLAAQSAESPTPCDQLEMPGGALIE